MKSSSIPLLLCLAVIMTLLFGCQSRGWQLVWSDDFSSGQLDTTVWSRIPRGTPDWQNTQDPNDDRLISWRNGNIVLRGIVNDHLDCVQPRISRVVSGRRTRKPLLVVVMPAELWCVPVCREHVVRGPLSGSCPSTTVHGPQEAKSISWNV